MIQDERMVLIEMQFSSNKFKTIRQGDDFSFAADEDDDEAAVEDSLDHDDDDIADSPGREDAPILLQLIPLTGSYFC